jgi:group I intron endonuclease
MNLHLERTIKALQYRYRGTAIVYGIRCQVNNMVYIGSSVVPAHRLLQHLVTGEKSNAALQADIAKDGIDKFTLYVFEEVSMSELSDLRSKEQHRMDQFPPQQLYNSIRSYQ